MGRMLRTRISGRAGKVGLDDGRFLSPIQASVTLVNGSKPYHYKIFDFFRGIFRSVKDVLF
jgi:hypothetical protein